MHHIVRTALSLFSFVGIAVLTFSTTAPYVEVAAADARSPCKTACVNTLPKECNATDPKYCWTGCPCAQPKAGRACGPSAPCDDGFQCSNGQCAGSCRTNDDCVEKGGGACKVGFCVRRSSDEARSCENACQSCIEKLRRCKVDYDRCAASCK